MFPNTIIPVALDSNVRNSGFARSGLHSNVRFRAWIENSIPISKFRTLGSRVSFSFNLLCVCFLPYSCQYYVVRFMLLPFGQLFNCLFHLLCLRLLWFLFDRMHVRFIFSNAKNMRPKPDSKFSKSGIQILAWAVIYKVSWIVKDTPNLEGQIEFRRFSKVWCLLFDAWCASLDLDARGWNVEFVHDDVGSMGLDSFLRAPGLDFCRKIVRFGFHGLGSWVWISKLRWLRSDL